MAENRGNNGKFMEEVTIRPEQFNLIERLYDASQRQEDHISQIASMAYVLHSINTHLESLVKLTSHQDERQDKLVQTIVGSKSHVPYWLLLLVSFVATLLISVLIVDHSHTSLKFNWPTGFEIGHEKEFMPNSHP